MNAEQGPQQAPGSVPNAFGNALAWKWVPNMPTKLRTSRFTTLLYALRALSNAAGEMRFSGDRKPIRIRDIARAIGANEKDTRRYLNAGIAAGLVGVKGEQRRGKPTLYVLLLAPNPQWGAALDSLQASRRKPGKGPAPWQDDEESTGPRDPNKKGSPRPVLETGEQEKERVPATPSSTGPRDPFGSGPRDPNNPGKAKELPQDMAEESSQPQVDGGQPDQQRDHSTQGQDQDGTAQPDLADVAAFTFCPECGRRFIPRRNRLNDRCTDCNGTSTAKTTGRSA